MSRARKNFSSRTLSRKELEEKLEEVMRRGGAEALNKIRSDSEKLCDALGLRDEFNIFERIIGSLLGTQEIQLHSSASRARKYGFPYDPKRIGLFSLLRASLDSVAPISRIAPSLPSKGLINLSFFEAYFSNFIEGTEFAVAEAIEIIFEKKIPLTRPEDAHDVLGTFKVVSNTQEMTKIPRDFEEFLDLLKKRHAFIMEGRPDKFPGIFKKDLNRAGSTTFVAPDLVIGTLKQGFDFYRSIEYPLYRAIFMMFLVSEIHPFTDGNGRLARIMMNAELVNKSEQRIIIPTVYRNNYLSSLRALSLNNIPEPLIRVLDFAQKYTLSIDYTDFNQANLLLEKTHAFLDPNEADEKGLRLTLPSG